MATLAAAVESAARDDSADFTPETREVRRGMPRKPRAPCRPPMLAAPQTATPGALPRPPPPTTRAAAPHPLPLSLLALTSPLTSRLTLALTLTSPLTSPLTRRAARAPRAARGRRGGRGAQPVGRAAVAAAVDHPAGRGGAALGRRLHARRAGRRGQELHKDVHATTGTAGWQPGAPRQRARGARGARGRGGAGVMGELVGGARAVSIQLQLSDTTAQPCMGRSKCCPAATGRTRTRATGADQARRQGADTLLGRAGRGRACGLGHPV